MGLDFTLSLAIREKDTKAAKWIIDIAYWRKAWFLSNRVVEIVSEPKYAVDNIEKFFYVSSTAALAEIANMIKDSVSDINSDFWTDSVFSATSTRHNSMIQLARIYDAIRWITDPEDDDAFELMWEDSDKLDTGILEAYLKEKDRYDIVLYTDYSY